MGLLVQAAWCSVSVWPCRASPVIVGGEVHLGGGGLTTSVGSEVAAALEPAELLAVSSTLSLWPTSPGSGVYVWVVAPESGPHLLPSLSHCSH